MAPDHKLTEDSLFAGRLQCVQPRHGYRFSIDAVLLAAFIAPGPGSRILDLGAGNGIVSLIIAYRWPETVLTALEIQPELVELAGHNSRANGFQERIRVMAGDYRRIADCLPAASFDLVVCNPPYRKAGSGRLNAGAQQAVARHELAGDFSAVAGASAYALRKGGRAAYVYPAERGAALIHELKKIGLETKRLQVVYSYPGAAGKLLLVEAVKGGGEGLKVLPPFYVYQEKDGPYSPEMEACYRS